MKNEDTFCYWFDPEIDRMLTNFYHMSGLRVGIHAPDMAILTEYPLKATTTYEQYRFCDKVRYFSDDYTERCSVCDCNAFAHIRATGHTYIYHCHRGFLEALIPITEGDEIICALVIGQVRDTALPAFPSDDKLAEFLHIMGIPDAEIETQIESYHRMPEMPRSRFEAYAYFLEMCAQSIYDNRWIQRDERTLADVYCEYVRKNIYRKITVSGTAAALHISASHLSRIIAKSLGTTFTRYVTECRMKIACHLLRTTQLSVSDIAKQLCYDEPTYFMRVFKRYTGFTCMEYKNQQDKNQT